MPWYCIIVYRNRLSDLSYVLYGEPNNYSATPDIYYGEAGAPRWDYPLTPKIYSIGGFTDSITTSTVSIGPEHYTYDPDTQTIRFSVDPFTLITPKTLQESGDEYIVLWARNVRIDINALQDQIGWIVQNIGESSDEYTQAIKSLWNLVVQGMDYKNLKIGIQGSYGLPYAQTDETVIWTGTDGYHHIVETDKNFYSFRNTHTLAAVAGTSLKTGDPLSRSVVFYEYTDLLNVPESDVPGLIFTVPLSTGMATQIIARNALVPWTYNASRPSPWRFELAGEPTELEQFWIDCQTAQTASGTTLASIFGLTPPGPGPNVNPMKMFIENLWKNNLVIIKADPSKIETVAPFFDRAQQLIPAWTRVVLTQPFGSATDIANLGVTTSESVGMSYNVPATTEQISVSATDLTFQDRTPLVTIS
jgi:hypothetical protein